MLQALIIPYLKFISTRLKKASPPKKNKSNRQHPDTAIQ
ncbi:hypothetical protein HPHPA20_0349 [Helicobacter pylori Hp A-20]|nr:hypothetical protein HPHPA20_0349 [Helicobacter pylori Hp A-20]